jgi:ABC-type glutathione transport system ATPase component
VIPLLSVRGLVRTFPVRSGLGLPSLPLPALDGVDVDVDAGSTFAVVGPSGAGKTTLVRCVLRMLDPDAGSIRLEGVELTGLGGRALRLARRPMQAVFQDPPASLDPLQDVLSAVAEPIVAHGLASRQEALDRAAALLDRVGLGPTHRDCRPFALSGGQAQRACLARALATSPRLLVCDEPTSALDGPSRDRILDLVASLQAEAGFGCLLVTHDTIAVRRLAGRAALLDRGRIVEIGSAEAVLGALSRRHEPDLPARAP